MMGGINSASRPSSNSKGLCRKALSLSIRKEITPLPSRSAGGGGFVSNPALSHLECGDPSPLCLFVRDDGFSCGDTRCQTERQSGEGSPHSTTDKPTTPYQ